MKNADIRLKSKKLIVLTSTLPRWKNDETTSFVLEHSKLLAPYFKQTIIVAPHFNGAKTIEKLPDNIAIHRIRYFFPAKSQDIFYGGDAVRRIKKTPLYALKVMSYMIIMFFHLVRLRLDEDTFINANWMIPQGYVAVVASSLFSKVKVITTVRGADIFALQGKVLTLMKRTALKKSDTVIVNSEQMEKACAKIYSRDYIKSPTGYDSTKFKQKTNYRKRHIGDPLHLLSVGRLSPKKV